MKTLMRAAALLVVSIFFSIPAFAATVTNMTLVGGCPSGEDDPECFDAGNANTTNVVLIVGVDESLVSEVSTGYSFDGLGTQTGNWSISDSSITHLAFKADGYYILGEVSGSSGVWSTVITDWSPDVTTLTCPVGICSVERFYTIDDFKNEGGNFADLSNVRAFSVVPIPAAVWLFGSALGLLGWMRRKNIVASK